MTWAVKRTKGEVTEWLMQDTEKFRSMQSKGINIPMCFNLTRAEAKKQLFEKTSPEWTYTIEEFLR